MQVIFIFIFNIFSIVIRQPSKSNQHIESKNQQTTDAKCSS